MELEVLLLGNNRLARLPPDLGNMASLAELDVSANQLTQLPSSVGKLSKLRSLVVRSNQLTSLPIGKLLYYYTILLPVILKIRNYKTQKSHKQLKVL